MTAAEVLKSLVFQALNQARDLAVAASGQPSLAALGPGFGAGGPSLSLSAADLQHAQRSGRGWADLLYRVLQQTAGPGPGPGPGPGRQPCFLVVDAEDLLNDDDERQQLSTGLGEEEERDEDEEIGIRIRKEADEDEDDDGGDVDEDEGDRLVRLLLGLLERFEGSQSVVKLLVVDYHNEWRAKLGRVQRTPARVVMVNREAPVPPPRRKPGAAKATFRGAEWARLVRPG